MKSKGFTLIELLIVVAIIAILAAIAIPNFLEAQTRSKVSRVLSDMRTIVTAYESYRVDNAWYPYLGDIDDIRNFGYCGVLEYLRWEDYQGERRGIGRLLTSPVAYLSAIPIDPFNTAMFERQRPHNFAYEVKNASAFVRGASPPGQTSSVCTFVWPAGNTSIGGGGVVSYEYVFQSVGPDLAPWPSNTNELYYDPTNGTLSKGDIVYVNTLGFKGAGQR